MPATTVHLGFALVVAAALLGVAYDRRALGILALVLVFPDLDAIPGWVLPGAHRAMFHTLVLVAIAVGLLYYDTRYRERSWLRNRGGPWAVRVAWTAVAVHLFAHVLLDYAHLSGINLIYPIGDQFFTLDGEVVYSTTDGIVQTFVDISSDGGEDGQPAIDVGQQGSTDDVHVPTPADPEPGGGADEGTERRIPFAVDGWELYVILLGLFTVGARRLQGEPPSGADGDE